MTRTALIIAILFQSGQSFAKVPVTGRAQHMSYTLTQVQAVAGQAYQRKISRLAARHELDSDRNYLHRVRKLCSRLITQAIQLKPIAASWGWEVHVTDDPDVDAYSMSGGKILVGTQFVHQYRLSDNELAVVLAHEIAHVIAEHVREQVSMAAGFNHSTPQVVHRLDDVLSDMQSDISVYLRLLPLSRLQEMEADDIGIELAARAGIPPSAIVSFYSKLGRDRESGQTLLDTHGAIAQRIRFVDSMASYAVPVYEASRTTRTLPAYKFSNSSH